MYELLNCVFKIMNDTGLYIKPEKMELFKDSTLVLGHIINRHVLRLNPDKVAGIKAAKIPENIKELRGFLSSINYLRIYISNCSQLQEPLTELLCKDVKFEMDKRRVEAFKMLKDHISNQVMLHAPAYSKGFVIACDASDMGVGAVLLQMQENEEVPLEFASKSFSPAEKN